MIPHSAPTEAQVRGWQVGPPHIPGVPPPPQVWPAGQLPQFSIPPQPSSLGPHCSFREAQVAGMQAPLPQTPGLPPPPQISGGVQVPQLRTPPQPSPAAPQL